MQVHRSGMQPHQVISKYGKCPNATTTSSQTADCAKCAGQHTVPQPTHSQPQTAARLVTKQAAATPPRCLPSDLVCPAAPQQTLTPPLCLNSLPGPSTCPNSSGTLCKVQWWTDSAARCACRRSKNLLLVVPAAHPHPSKHRCRQHTPRPLCCTRTLLVTINSCTC
jgi:hypothetical protein